MGPVCAGPAWLAGVLQLWASSHPCTRSVPHALVTRCAPCNSPWSRRTWQPHKGPCGLLKVLLILQVACCHVSFYRVSFRHPDRGCFGAQAAIAMPCMTRACPQKAGCHCVSVAAAWCVWWLSVVLCCDQVNGKMHRPLCLSRRPLLMSSTSGCRTIPGASPTHPT